MELRIRHILYIDILSKQLYMKSVKILYDGINLIPFM